MEIVRRETADLDFRANNTHKICIMKTVVQVESKYCGRHSQKFTTCQRAIHAQKNTS